MPWPEERPDCIRPEDAARMEFVQGVIVAVRTIKAELDIAPSHKVVLKLHPADKTQEDLLLSNASTIQTLARLESMEVGMEVHAPKASASSVVQGCEIIVPLKGNVDLQGELARLAKEMGKIADALAVVDKKLSNESFVSRAKPEIVQRERDRAAELKDNLGKLEAKEMCQLTGILQISTVSADSPEAHRFAAGLTQTYPGITASHVNRNYVDTTAFGANKGEGIRRIAEAKGWNPDDIYTIGDGHNDLPMLTAFHGAAPVSAEKGVLAQISKTVDSVEDYINQLLA